MADWKMLWEDHFEGPEPDLRWAGGQLKEDTRLRLRVQDGVHVEMQEGGSYASGGLVTREALPGDFAAEVEFEVSRPRPGSTLELAAIRPAPPSATVLNPSRKEDCALVFNVHGEPPYVSSEFDEDDGWRIGWNVEAPSFKFDAEGQPYASGENNQYGVNTAKNGVAGPSRGFLWLERVGQTWRARGRAETSAPWLDFRPHHQSDKTSLDGKFLTGPVHLRLVAKHWAKPDEGAKVPPANTVVFKHFRLFGRT